MSPKCSSIQNTQGGREGQNSKALMLLWEEANVRESTGTDPTNAIVKSDES